MYAPLERPSHTFNVCTHYAVNIEEKFHNLATTDDVALRAAQQEFVRYLLFDAFPPEGSITVHVNRRDRYGRTARGMARRGGRTEVVALIDLYNRRRKAKESENQKNERDEARQAEM